MLFNPCAGTQARAIRKQVRGMKESEKRFLGSTFIKAEDSETRKGLE